MGKVCYLHLGFHKTASTSFQHTCSKNVDLLRKNNITYPIFSCPITNKSWANHSIPICSLSTGKPQKKPYYKRKNITKISDAEEIVSSVERQLVDFMGSSNKLLISGEVISELNEKSLSNLIYKISHCNYEIKATALVRNPYSSFCSLLQERIKKGKYYNLISLNDSIPTSFEGAPLGKSRIAQKLKSILGESISFKSFTRACMHSYGPVGFLLEEFLNQDPSTFEYLKKNESLYNLSTRMQNEFNLINPSYVDGKVNNNFARFPAEVDKKFGFSSKFLLTEAEYSLIKEFIELETKKLYEICALDFSDQSIEFSRPIF